VFIQETLTLEGTTMDLNLIYNFMSSCDQTLANLRSAQRTEMLDASTSNNSLIGWFISTGSSAKNYSAARQVDALQQQAFRINQAMHYSGVFQKGGFPLSTDFDGRSIRQSENAEHDFVMNWIAPNSYSSMASINTLQELNNTISKVQQVRYQAACLANVIAHPSASFPSASFPSAVNPSLPYPPIFSTCA
jgi:hypothetical protein